MLVYVVLLILILSIGLVSRLFNVNSKYYLMIVFGIILLIYALRRVDVGTDTITYKQYFNAFRNMTWSDIMSRNFDYDVEKGWAVLCKIVGGFTRNFNVFMTLVGGFYLYCIYRLIIYTKIDPYIAVLAFAYNGLFVQPMNLMRQYCAVGLMTLAWINAREKKIIQTGALAIMAFAIHTSAIAFIPILIVTVIKEKRIRNFLVSFGLVSVFFIVKYYGMIENYMYSIGYYGKFRGRFVGVESGLSKMIWLVELLVAIFVFVYRESIDDEREEEISPINLLMVLLYFTLNMISVRFYMLQRISRYYQIAVITNYSNLISILKRKIGFLYIPVEMLMIACFSALFIISIYSNIDQYFYHFVWESY